MHPIRTTLAVLFLSVTLAPAEPLSNEDLLALRSAEYLAQSLTAPISSGPSQQKLGEAMDLMRPVLERPLPAPREVWVALGRWAVAAQDPAAGAVVLAGLRREAPDFMTDEILADIAAKLHANTRARQLVPQAQERLEGGDTPLVAIRHVGLSLSFLSMADTVKWAVRDDQATSAALWGGLAPAFDRAGLSNMAETARMNASALQRDIKDPAQLARVLIDTAEGQILFDARREAAGNLTAAMDNIRTLPDGSEKNELLTDTARFMARAWMTEEAAEIIESLEPDQAAKVRLEVARTLAQQGEYRAADQAIDRITKPYIADLARIGIIRELAKAGRIAEAEARAAALSDPIASAEAQAMILAHTEESTLDPAAWRPTLLHADPDAQLALTIVRVLGVYGERLENAHAFINLFTSTLSRERDLTSLIYQEQVALGIGVTHYMTRSGMLSTWGPFARYSMLIHASDTLSRAEKQ
ncbi:MAG: hypothetical protein LAT64_02270 [Phycisphaerales bacterium]|nr:hypothetical protein [Planctomycetota bacterium]MCH8507584.1 hypothetical protein [Phycisphaerales bacterium]